MKKVLLLMCLVFPLVIQSCSDDDESGTSPDSLIGTTWLYNKVEGEVTFETTINFKTSTVVEGIYDVFYEDGTSEPRKTEEGTYSYSKPTIIISLDNEVNTGVVAGNKMIMTYTDDYGIVNSDTLFLKK